MFKKRWIAILVVFALISGTAYAQVTYGGQLQMGTNIISGTNVKEADIMSGGAYGAPTNYHEAKFSAVFGDGQAGGRLVWRLNDRDAWGWMQWRPNEFFRIKIGHDRDGEWGGAQISGWGFTGEAKNSVGAVNDWSNNSPQSMGYVRRGFYGGIGDGESFSVLMSFWPMDNVQVNFGVPNFSEQKIDDQFAKAHLGAIIRIEEVGVARVYFQGRGGLAKDSADPIGNIFASFFLNSIQGMALDLGFKYSLPAVDVSDTYDNMDVGLGFTYGADPFNVKFRLGASFGGKSGGEARDPQLAFGILPYYKLPKMWVFFHAGMGMTLADEVTSDWFINPYVWVPMGSMRMWVGLQIEDMSRVREGEVKWNVPFGFNFYF